MSPETLFESLPSDWEYVTLGDACARSGGDIQTGPFGSQLHASDYVEEGVPSIMPQNIGDNRVIEDGIARVSVQDAERLSRYRVRPGDIVYSRRGDVERRALIREAEDGWLCGTGCLRLRFGDDVDPLFASYYLGHPNVREWIVRHAHGATMPNLNTSILSSLPFAVPPLREQRAIARILGALDNKIELNRRMNETLEAMARAIFKNWFVDFDPVRAKAAGRQPHGMDAETAALFPDAFEDSPLVEIPKGWRVVTIADLAEIVGGSTPRTDEPSYWNEGEHHWVTPKDLSKLTVPALLTTERKITTEGLSQISSGLLPAGTVLLSSRAPIGYLAINEIPVAVNQGFIAIKPKDRVSSLFLLFWAHRAHDEITSRANGSTFLEISKSNFRSITLIAPEQNVMQTFDQTIRPMYAQIVANERQSQSLIVLRDTLLSKLFSGEVRIHDLKDLLEN